MESPFRECHLIYGEYCTANGKYTAVRWAETESCAVNPQAQICQVPIGDGVEHLHRVQPGRRGGNQDTEDCALRADGRA